jgi:hypothetical protein
MKFSFLIINNLFYLCIVAFKCDFDSTQCGFRNKGSGDQFNWIRQSGSTPSSGTGPSGDHTTGNGELMFIIVILFSPAARFYTTDLDFSQTSHRVYIRLRKHGKRFLFVKCVDLFVLGQYMYIEASYPRIKGDKARLSRKLDLFPETCIRFFYHMYGRQMGKLVLKVDGFLVFEKKGNQGNKWIDTGVLYLSGFQGQDLKVSILFCIQYKLTSNSREVAQRRITQVKTVCACVHITEYTKHFGILLWRKILY